MSLETEAYVCKAKGEPLKLEKIVLPPLEANEVECDMVCCGLCHTDCHMCTNDWGISDFPMVPGHEGVGIVRAVGSAVSTHAVGDRVGIAWMRDSCQACEACLCGRENICQPGYQGTFLSKSAGVWGKKPYNLTGGCFSKVMRVAARFAFKIPEGVPDDVACPLLCGGGTVYEPLCDYCEPGTQLGVAGIGGLGTAAIKLAKLRGVTPTAISSSPHKKQAALAAGAKDFVCFDDDLAAWAGKFDVIIDTSPANTQPAATYLNLLKFGGTYCRVGIPAAGEGFKYDWIPLIFTQRKVVGSIVTGSKCMHSMFNLVKDNLDFLQADNPDLQNIEKVPFSQANAAMKNLVERKNKGYRYVLVW
ncbi:hypothetical protein CTAYLR_009256 [Chrysophaeum taylorii]|uniref:Enoyl reductase (ER) domain-containing protein n=1 Tax=Chrysophaeum taylorii TaxID=2483200 RepID=A0AAD7XQ21_9STRA|nr:hypothetical protein CTAYLR_009256 [Chrysophaeum taylorii]